MYSISKRLLALSLLVTAALIVAPVSDVTLAATENRRRRPAAHRRLISDSG